MKQFLKDHSFRGLHKRHPQLIAYVVLVIAVLWGFFSINLVIHQQKEDRIAGRKVACLVLNQTRDGLNQFRISLIEASKKTPPPQPLTPEEQQRVNEAIVDFNNRIDPSVKHINCVLFSQDPEKFFQKNFEK